MKPHKPTSARRTSPKPTTADISAACAYLMQAPEHEFAAVIKWMQAREKRERAQERTPRKRIRTLYSRTGKKIELFNTDVERMTKK